VDDQTDPISNGNATVIELVSCTLKLIKSRKCAELEPRAEFVHGFGCKSRISLGSMEHPPLGLTEANFAG